MQVEEGAYLNLAAKKYLEGLDAQERRFAAALVYTTLENLLRNELLPQDQEESSKQKFPILNLLRVKRNGGADDEK